MQLTEKPWVGKRGIYTSYVVKSSIFCKLKTTLKIKSIY
jgi:hypothetical protein